MLNLKENKTEPLYIQIKNEIIKMIASGALNNGDALPSVRSLADFLDVNMHTVNKSYTLLKEEGFITIEPGKGAFVKLNLEKSNSDFSDSLSSIFKTISAECFIRGIDKKDLINIIKKEFAIYK